MTSDVTEEDVAHNSLVDEIRKINSIDRKKSKRAQLKNVRVTRELEIPSKKLGNILSKIGGKTKQKRKLEPLIEPLDKPKAKRLQREAGFEHVAIEANKWAGVVQERKRADQLHFPLEKVDLRVITSEKNYKPLIKTDLEKLVYELLDGTTALETQEKLETEEEKTIKKAMSLKDIRERSSELMKNRNLKMRLERKAALLNKSKSRKYHKILRRERLKRLKQEYENLKATNPEAALDILNKIEKTRVKERMDLRHKRSKWLNLQQSRASRDDRIRELLKENKEIRLEMLEKLKFLQESDVENNDEEDSDSDQNEKINKIKKDQAQAIKNGKFDSENLWVKHLAVPDSADSNPDESFYKMKKYWEDRHEEKQRELEALKVVKEYEKKQKKSNCNEKEKEVEENEETQKANKEDEIEDEEEEEIEIEVETEERERNVNKPDKKKEKSGKIVDRKLGSAKHDRGFLKRILNNDESDSEKEDFEDIFADVDYAKEFEKDKKEHEESRKLKDIDNFKAAC
ncbi:U3 small nucleolar RNA-associated protein 14-like protein B [Armadillidium nasatum]|uniref:U3 small nucleolar RNA-associated protein 14-like protein B n=1 Tax=Armadillidium nasatum TaxID=96803 RepID=A0A5N5TAV8_9CRUS|nr:U3 small nucleolar RNA-associated protein 14-like protein B [Armadillidium nasatum]